MERGPPPRGPAAGARLCVEAGEPDSGPRNRPCRSWSVWKVPQICILKYFVYLIFKKDFIYLFIFRERGREGGREGKNKH